jgi:hypothetical protein
MPWQNAGKTNVDCRLKAGWQSTLVFPAFCYGMAWHGIFSLRGASRMLRACTRPCACYKLDGNRFGWPVVANAWH